MINKKANIETHKIYKSLEDYPAVIEAEEEQIQSEPSLVKQNYGWVSLGGAFVILSIVLIFLLLRSKQSIALMVSMIILTFIIGTLLIVLPLVLSKYRLCSIQMIELAGSNVYDEFHFLTTDNTFDKALQNSFGNDFYFKLTEKKELEVLVGKKNNYSFTTYDFKAMNQSVSTIPQNIEGTLIRIKLDTGVKTSTYAVNSTYSDFFTPLEKLSIGGDGFTYFGNSKKDINNKIDLDKLSKLDQNLAVSITNTGINILLFGKTVDIRKIGRGNLTQEKYEQVVSNFDTLTYILESIR